MKKYGIPTAAYETFDDPEKALAYLETAKMPYRFKGIRTGPLKKRRPDLQYS